MNASRPRIVVLDDFERALRRLADWSEIDSRADVAIYHDSLRREALYGAIVDADVIVLVRDRTPLRADLIERLPKLRYVIFTGARNTALDAAALAARGIPVSHTEWGPSKESTCELTWALILAASKRLEAKFAVDSRWRLARRSTAAERAGRRTTGPDRARRDRGSGCARRAKLSACSSLRGARA